MGTSKGIYVSKGCCGFSIFTIVALLVAEGLIIGFVGVCEVEPVPVTSPPPTTTTAADVVEHGVWENGLLPSNLKPLHYSVTLKPVFEMVDGTYWFYGSSSVQYTCIKSTNYIILHSTLLELEKEPSIVQDSASKEVQFKRYFFYEENEYIVFETPQGCIAGENYTVYFDGFKGELSTTMDGFYRSEYRDENGINRVIAASHNEMFGVRRTFPSFDEPQLKAYFDIKMQHPQDYIATSNSRIRDTKEISTDLLETTFERSPLMSSYLLVLTVHDFTSSETPNGNDIQSKVYARREAVANGEAMYASEITPEILDFFGKYLSITYRLPKSDQMALPDFDAGAMENWGLVLYKEYYLLYNESLTGPYFKYRITQVVAHELAHQWFGDLVTTQFWNEIWLNEGFASYFQYLGVTAVQPDWPMEEYFIIDDFQAALYTDDSSGSHPMVHSYTHKAWDSTVAYSKGASILRMTNRFLGEDTFVAALKKYLNYFEYDVSDTVSLYNFFGEQAESDTDLTKDFVVNVMNSWTLQMGFPLITLKRDPSSNQIQATQEIFLINPGDEPPPQREGVDLQYLWYVPFTWRPLQSATPQDDQYNQIHWMMPDNNGLTIDFDDFIVANTDAIGIYRVNYDSDMWNAIINKLKSSSFKDIPAQNRAQFIDDAYTIAQSRINSATSALEISSYLYQETDYIPWYTFNAHMLLHYDRMLASSTIYGEFSKHILELVVPSLWSKYGLDDTDQSDSLFFDRMARGVGVEVACHYGYKGCLDSAVEMYAKWMQDSTYIISGTYRDDIVCTAIAAGGVAEWDFAWEQFQNTDSAQLQQSLRYGMSCSRLPWVITRYIDYTLDRSLIRLQDLSSTLGYIGRHEANKYVVWAYVLNNWDRLTEAIGSSVTSLLTYAKTRFTTTFDLKLIDDLRDVAGPSYASTCDSYETTVLMNMKWREDFEEEISQWLGVQSYNLPDSVRVPHGRQILISNLIEERGASFRT